MPKPDPDRAARLVAMAEELEDIAGIFDETDDRRLRLLRIADDIHTDAMSYMPRRKPPSIMRTQVAAPSPAQQVEA